MVIGIGCDIVKIVRIQSQIHNDTFLKTILTKQEYQLCQSFQEQRKAEWVAGRFAAKEAIYKAINTMYPCVISQIEILADDTGRPYCTLMDFDIQISIAHEHEYAIAYAIANMKE